MTRQAATPEIHQEKREVVENVGAGDLVVELDAIEERRPAIEQHDVAQVQVAVALPHESRGTAFIEQRSTTVEFARAPFGQPAARAGIQNALTVLSESGGIAVDHPCHPWLATVIGPALRRHMKLGDGGRQSWHQSEIQAPGRGESVEERLLREAIHLDHPIDGRASAVECECSVRFAGDGHDASIDGRCGASIEAHLGVTHRATAFCGREIEIIESDGPLELVGTLPGEEDDGAVRVDPFDTGPTVRRRRRKEPNDLGLILGDHRLTDDS